MKTFQATEFRGFEYLVKGAPAEDMVVIVPRIHVSPVLLINIF